MSCGHGNVGAKSQEMPVAIISIAVACAMRRTTAGVVGRAQPNVVREDGGIQQVA